MQWRFNDVAIARVCPLPAGVVRLGTMGQTSNDGEGGDTAGGRSGRGGRGRGRGGRNRGKAGESADGGEAGGGRGDATAPAATAASSPPPPPSATALRATSAAFIPRSVTVPNRPRAVPPAPTPAPTAKGGASSGKQKKATRPKKSGVADRADVSPVDPPADPPPDAVPKNKQNKNKASAKRSTKGTGGRPDNWWKTITQCGKFILITVRAIRLTPCFFFFYRSNHAGAPRGLGPPPVRATNTHGTQLAHRVAPLRPNLPRRVGDGEQTVRKPTQQNPDGRRRLPPTR